MKMVVSAVLDDFWGNVFNRLKNKVNCEVVYWVGKDKKGQLPFGAFYHEVWDAFALKGLDDVRYGQLDVSLVNLQDYYNYQKILDRYDYNGHFTFSERDVFFKKQIDYWLAVIKKHKPDLVFFSNAPHLAYCYALYVASKLSGVPKFMMNVSPFPGWHYGSYDIGRLVDVPFKKTG